MLLASRTLCEPLILNAENDWCEAKVVLTCLNFSTSSEMKSEIAMMLERREHARLKLRIPVLLSWEESKNPVRSETLDISSRGFYCTTKEPFAPGDRLRALLSIPAAYDPKVSDLYLDAEVEVMRVIIDNVISGFGLGCRIADFHVVDQQTAMNWPSHA